jgi:hypothetical protein
MRIWSLHPSYLDSKGLVALWRETLLAKHVLEGKTRGYKNHPQLIRFKESENPVDYIHQYLSIVYTEASDRGYNFDKSKIRWEFEPETMTVTKGQLLFEKNHLLHKLKIRDHNRYIELLNDNEILPHPLFEIIEGNIEKWEITQTTDTKIK